MTTKQVNRVHHVTRESLVSAGTFLAGAAQKVGCAIDILCAALESCGKFDQEQNDGIGTTAETSSGKYRPNMKGAFGEVKHQSGAGAQFRLLVGAPV